MNIDDLKVQNTNADYSKVKYVQIISQQHIENMNTVLKSSAFILLGVASGTDKNGFPTHTFALGCIADEYKPSKK